MSMLPAQLRCCLGTFVCLGFDRDVIDIELDVIVCACKRFHKIGRATKASASDEWKINLAISMSAVICNHLRL